MIEIITLESLNDEKAVILQQVKDIFFLSSSIKEFSTPEKKEAFFKKWCGDYITFFPQLFFIMKEEEKVLGYLSGCLNSLEASLVLEIPGYDLFADQFEMFPAHLHINFHPDCRGRGLGSVLVDHFCQQLKLTCARGVHLITSKTSPNVSFYRRLRFNVEIEREFNHSELFFMGRILERNGLV